MQNSALNAATASVRGSQFSLQTPSNELARVFNTALVATRTEAVRDFSAELYSLVESPAFQAILLAVRQLAKQQGTSEQEASEQIIKTFRKMDRTWSDYLFHEGVDRLFKPANN